jgi:hypothetical protein
MDYNLNILLTKFSICQFFFKKKVIMNQKLFKLFTQRKNITIFKFTERGTVSGISNKYSDKQCLKQLVNQGESCHIVMEDKLI